MSDFASAAMMRVLAAGMRLRGLDPGDSAQTTDDARVQLRAKQDLVRLAVDQGGLACLSLLGRGLHELTHEPTHHALASARGAQDLFERWQRLERYIHSRHRCVIGSCSTRRAVIRHVAVTGEAAPSPAEDLVVAGVLAALLEAIGLQRVELRLGDELAFPVAEPEGIAQAAARGATHRWSFRWEGVATAPPSSLPQPATQALGADKAWSQPVHAAYRRLAADLTRPPSLADLAADLSITPRTLQRRLGEQRLTYSRLLAEARCRTGAWRLLHTTDPIAEVGFLSGFADQAHFTREMRRRVGMPPAAYRQAFAGASEA